ncbi:hypothetical protein AB0M20_10940 [Actinoplanes sp. NPDC051633]|uniref:hypothetical protein n=1 Tax=Actinoplanes sp. NPDC051633 TaxID=3155670 RepID=UPI0034130BB6
MDALRDELDGFAGGSVTVTVEPADADVWRADPSAAGQAVAVALLLMIVVAPAGHCLADRAHRSGLGPDCELG